MKAYRNILAGSHLALPLSLLTACGSPGNIKLEDPAKPIREAGETIGQLFEGAPPLESIGLSGPLREVRASR